MQDSSQKFNEFFKNTVYAYSFGCAGVNLNRGTHLPVVLIEITNKVSLIDSFTALHKTLYAAYHRDKRLTPDIVSIEKKINDNKKILKKALKAKFKNIHVHLYKTKHLAPIGILCLNLSCVVLCRSTVFAFLKFNDIEHIITMVWWDISKTMCNIFISSLI